MDRSIVHAVRRAEEARNRLDGHPAPRQRPDLVPVAGPVDVDELARVIVKRVLRALARRGVRRRLRRVRGSVARCW